MMYMYIHIPVPSKKMRKKTFTKTVSGDEAGSVSQRYGSADPGPDPYQIVTDPEDW
jgi:hypothetical protein